MSVLTENSKMGVLPEKFFDGVDHKDIFLYTISNDKGMKAQITNYGAILVSLMVPDKNGKIDDVVLGFDNISQYYEDTTFIGATIGRHANRIEGASFEINGVLYELEKNDGNNHLHGGSKSFHKKIWKAEPQEKANSLTLSYFSKDGEDNYPGNLKVSVTYSITDDNSLKIDYYAVSDKDTVVNLTNHTYFNLAGKESNDILDHQLKIYADSFTPVDEACIPTGEIRQVFGTPFDFTKMKPIKPDIFSDDIQITYGKGFDHNWILNAKGDISQKAVEVFEPISGRSMEVYTSLPGMQFYAGNCMKDSEVGKYGVTYKKRSGFCLESQYFPNSLKHKHFPSPILKAGNEYKHTTIYKFV
jgi:aldose 1-epimerase